MYGIFIKLKQAMKNGSETTHYVLVEIPKKPQVKIMGKTPEGPFLVFCDEGHREEGD